MITVTPFEQLGAFRNEWLDARHHFSFGGYHDPARMGVGPLRVWNDDEIAPGQGFGAHPHRDMEIITYVRDGAITHRDSLGNEGRTEAGDVQVMHAGTGITHAEMNLEKVPTRLFQIWLKPNRQGVAPGWAAAAFPRGGEGLPVLASGDDTDIAAGALPLYADGRVRAGTLVAGQAVTLKILSGRAAYLVPAKGTIMVNGQPAFVRDGVTVDGEQSLTIVATQDAEVVMVEVAAEG